MSYKLYDAEIEYLETQSNCYIVTNSVPSGSDIAISSKFMFIGYVNNKSWLPWYISYVNENTQTFRIARDNSSNTTVRINNGAVANGATSDAQFNVSANGIYEIATNGQTITVNGVTKTGRVASSSLNTAPMRIMNAAFKGRCYYFKMWNGNTLLLDCIPVRVGNVGYMYDKVSGKLFGNAGTGSFVLGPDVAPGRYANEVAFLESWGNQYIDTGIKPSTDTKIELKCLYCKSGAGLTNYGALIGADDRDNAYVLNHSDMANFTFGTSVSKDFANPQTRLLTFDSTASSNSMSVYDEGGSLVTTLTCIRGVFEVNQNLYLFAVNRSGTPVYGSNRILYCKIYDGDTLVRDYVPVEYNGVGYMYDKVSGLFFDNKGTGKFLFGSIAKACARSYTRRQLMADIVAPKPYISKGMVFHLDGRDYDHETKKWKDRIRGLVFSMTGTSISQDGLGVYFNGSAYSTLSNWFGTAMSSCTLEVVYNKTGADASVCAAGASGWTQYRRIGNNVWRRTGTSIAICPNAYGMVTHSLTDAINIFNGRSLGYQSGETYFNRGTNSNFYIGRDNNNQYRMVGNIYQIRIYNRRLSLDEIAYNQEQDRKRYGITFLKE